MAIKNRDWIFILIILAVLGTFIAISGKEKTKKIPYDATHREFYQMRDANKRAIEIDPLCAKCHDGVQIPFPPAIRSNPERGRCAASSAISSTPTRSDGVAIRISYAFFRTAS